MLASREPAYVRTGVSPWTNRTGRRRVRIFVSIGALDRTRTYNIYHLKVARLPNCATRAYNNREYHSLLCILYGRALDLQEFHPSVPDLFVFGARHGTRTHIVLIKSQPYYHYTKRTNPRHPTTRRPGLHYFVLPREESNLCHRLRLSLFKSL